MTELRQFLLTVYPFSTLSAGNLDRISSLAREVSFSKGQSIYSEGDRAENIWILKSGRLEIIKYSADGHPTAIELIYPRNILGTLCRIGNRESPYPCTATADCDSVVIRIEDSAFWDLLHQNPTFLFGICTLCSRRLTDMQEGATHAHEHVEKRIIRALVQLSRRHGSILAFTKREIAEIAATSVETTIRMLSGFEKKKLISTTRGRIVLKDAKKLESLIE